MLLPSLSSRSLLATALLAGAIDSASAAPGDGDRVADPREFVRCGVENIPGPELMKLEEEFKNQRVMLGHEREGNNDGDGGGGASINDPVTVNVYMHVISTNETSEGGHVSDKQIEDQITVLNTDYQAMNIDFKVTEVTRTMKPEWFMVKANSKEQADMKRSLRQGGPSDLNVYLGCLEPAGLLGYATFPRDVRENLIDDGVVILYSSLPGGSAQPYNEGRTLTHEVGHWLGLYHTFQGGCDEPGDLVDDTPAEAKPGFGCPEGRKSCRNSKGVDPIHNFMDYGDDTCLNSFTPGQVARARDQIAIYRGIKAVTQTLNHTASVGGGRGGKHHTIRPGKPNHRRRWSF